MRSCLQVCQLQIKTRIMKHDSVFKELNNAHWQLAATTSFFQQLFIECISKIFLKFFLKVAFSLSISPFLLKRKFKYLYIISLIGKLSKFLTIFSWEIIAKLIENEISSETTFNSIFSRSIAWPEVLTEMQENNYRLLLKVDPLHFIIQYVLNISGAAHSVKIQK